MNNTLDRLIENEVTCRLSATLQLPPVVYGVWIDGKGWLRNESRRMFSDAHREVAETAARLYGKRARVLAVDVPAPTEQESALGELERTFLAQESEIADRRWSVRLMHWLKEVRSWQTS